MIGVFDSGYGGLTILRALVHNLPQYSYLYLGDNVHAPYGSRSDEEIYEFTKRGVEYLFNKGCPLAILACNTASACALRRLQQEWLPTAHPDKRLLGIVVPTIEQITGVPWSHRPPVQDTTHDQQLSVGVLATQKTVDSNAYEFEIHKRNPGIRVRQLACPNLVPLIEQHAAIEDIRRELKACLEQLQPADLDAVLLGCTHYELIAEEFRQLLPPHVRLYEQPKIVAASLAAYLARHPELEQQLSHDGELLFLTTGDKERASAQSSLYFGQPITFDSA